MKWTIIVVMGVSAMLGKAVSQESKATGKPVKGYPAGVTEIRFRSEGDSSEQPALFWKPGPAGDKAVPLLVALHTWSGNYRQAGGEAKYAEWCQKMGWVFIHPDFRGPNWTPDALGSDLAVADILSAVDYAKANAKVDENRIYCIGVSGGGHASLLMAGRAPELWAGVSAWCGISDLESWHRECSGTQFSRYAEHIEKALGGAPDSSKEMKARALRRSPSGWLSKAGGVNLDINHGINDGRTGSVPFTHSLIAYNLIVPDEAKISPELIHRFYDTTLVPQTIRSESDGLLADPHEHYGKRVPLYRKIHGSTRVTIFDGGHEIIHNAALNWLAAQEKGKPANWSPQKIAELETSEAATQSGK